MVVFYKKVRCEMYILKVKDVEYTIPKENIRALAMLKAKDYNYDLPILNDDIAIAYLQSLGIEVTDGGDKE